MTAAAVTGSGGNNKMLSLAEAAELVGISPSALRRRWREWGIPACKIGGRLKVRERNLQTWLARGLPDDILPLIGEPVTRAPANAAQARARRELVAELRRVGVEEEDVKLFLDAAEAAYARLQAKSRTPCQRQRENRPGSAGLRRVVAAGPAGGSPVRGGAGDLSSAIRERAVGWEAKGSEPSWVSFRAMSASRSPPPS